MEETNVRPGVQLLTWVHNLEVNIGVDAYISP